MQSPCHNIAHSFDTTERLDDQIEKQSGRNTKVAHQPRLQHAQHTSQCRIAVGAVDYPRWESVSLTSGRSALCIVRTLI